MTVLLVIHLLVAIALICVVLMQRSAQDGGGLMGGGGTMGGLFTSRGSANLLSRTTAVLATIFIGLSLVLGVMASQRHQERSVAEQIESAAQTEDAPNVVSSDEAVKEAAPAEPTAPVEPLVPEVPVSK